MIIYKIVNNRNNKENIGRIKKDMANKKVSVVIAVLNSHRVVIRQIRHFKRMNLTDDVEFIFVDDGSNPPIKYTSASTGLKNLMVYYTNDKRPWTQGLARNIGASKAKGEFLFFTDIDHIITKEAIDAVLEFNGDKMVFVRHFGVLNRYGDIVSDRKSMLRFGLDPARRADGGVHGNTYAIRKTIFDSMNGYDTRYCQSGFHVGGRFMSEERNFNLRWGRRVSRGLSLPESLGPNIYHYPVSKFRTDKNNNPYGLFHGLSLEQTPQPMKG